MRWVVAAGSSLRPACSPARTEIFSVGAAWRSSWSCWCSFIAREPTGAGCACPPLPSAVASPTRRRENGRPMVRTRHTAALLVGVVALTAACTGGPTETAARAPASSARPSATASPSVLPLPTAAPAASGVDPARLEALADEAEAAGSSCVLAMRRGQVAGEWYWRGATPHTSREVFSVTKSVASTLVGIASARVCSPLTGAHPPTCRCGRARLPPPSPVRNLLSNDSGRGWSVASDYTGLVKAKDRTAYAVGLPQQHRPGTVWAYNNAAVQTLDAVLVDATGRRTARFAQGRLFAPLGMRDTRLTPSGRGVDEPRLRDAVHLPRPGAVRAALRPGRAVGGPTGRVPRPGWRAGDRVRAVPEAERRLRLPVVAPTARAPCARRSTRSTASVHRSTRSAAASSRRPRRTSMRRTCESRTNNSLAKLLECVDLAGVREHQAALPGDRRFANGGHPRRPGRPAATSPPRSTSAERLTAAGWTRSELQAFQFQTFVAVAPPDARAGGAPARRAVFANTIMSYSGSGDVTAPVSALPGPAGRRDTRLRGGRTSPASPAGEHRAGLPRRLHLRDQGDQRPRRRRRREW